MDDSRDSHEGALPGNAAAGDAGPESRVGGTSGPAAACDQATFSLANPDSSTPSACRCGADVAKTWPEVSPVFSLARAAAYLGLAELGVRNPEESIHRLYKDKKLKGIVIVGHLAFLQDHLDEYLDGLRKAVRQRRPHRGN